MAKRSVTKERSKVANRRVTVTPVNVIDLMDKVGGSRTAELLGVSRTLLYKAKEENQISKSVEVAAIAALAELGRAPGMPAAHVSTSAHTLSRDVAFFVTVAADKSETFQRVATSLGAIVVPA